MYTPTFGIAQTFKMRNRLAAEIKDACLNDRAMMSWTARLIADHLLQAGLIKEYELRDLIEAEQQEAEDEDE